MTFNIKHVIIYTPCRSQRVLIQTRDFEKGLCMARLLVIALVLIFTSSAFAAKQKQVLLPALIKVESGGRDDAVGDSHLKDKAYGALQIRQPCVDDVNRRYGTSYRAEDCLNNRQLSIWICQRYIALYATEKSIGRTPTDQDRARIWNGGPQGWKSKRTLGYWAKVQKAMNA